MGFKDLALFNDALLAKQAWRLPQNKNSLFYRVFKPNFFPHCSIMEVTKSQARSYAWRSILKGREVLKEGMRWRVANGSSIRIWSDPWLPQNFCLSLPLQQHRVRRMQEQLPSLILPIRYGIWTLLNCYLVQGMWT